MPRKNKNQPVAVTAPGQPYGIAGEQREAMRLLPLPDTQVDPSMTDPTAPAPMDGSSPTPASAEPEMSSMDQAIQAALTSPSPDAPAFSAATRRPEESIFTPAAMPMQRPSDVGNILRALAADAGGDPILSQMAAQADEQRL